MIRHEEKRLEELFGDEFKEYKKQVPAFFPRRANFSEPDTYVVRPYTYRKHMFNALWFIWIVGILEVVEGLREIGVLTSFATLF